MTTFRSSALLLAALTTPCGGSTFKPRNELESLMQGKKQEAVFSIEAYIKDHEGDRDQLESDLLESGFLKREFIEKSTEFETTRINCQFFSYRRKDGFIFDASAVVWLCDEGCGANFGYIGP
jgi:hypothetical protein